MFSQCWTQGQESKNVLVLGHMKADGWNVCVFVYLYTFIYTYIYVYAHMVL